MNIRKISIILTAAMLITAFSACGSSDEAAETADVSAEVGAEESEAEAKIRP